MKVTAKVRIEEVEGRRIQFSAEVFDEKEKVGEGRHVRVIVDQQRVQGRLSQLVQPGVVPAVVDAHTQAVSRVLHLHLFELVAQPD